MTTRQHTEFLGYLIQPARRAAATGPNNGIRTHHHHHCCWYPVPVCSQETVWMIHCQCTDTTADTGPSYPSYRTELLCLVRKRANEPVDVVKMSWYFIAAAPIQHQQPLIQDRNFNNGHRCSHTGQVSACRWMKTDKYNGDLSWCSHRSSFSVLLQTFLK